MFYNPYESILDEGMRWLKVNFHVHAGVCVKGECGEFPMWDVVDAYVQAGYHALTVSNHNRYIPFGMERGGFIGSGGRLLYETLGSSAEYAVDEAEQYVRVEATAENGAKMYLQPIKRA